MRRWEDGELEYCMRQWHEVVARLEEAGVDYSELSEKMADYQERYDNYDGSVRTSPTNQVLDRE